MEPLGWIVAGGLVMTSIAAVGSLTLLLKQATLQKIVSPLVAFAAGNSIYIGASDLVPEINKHQNAKANLVHFVCFALGLGLLALIRLALGG